MSDVVELFDAELRDYLFRELVFNYTGVPLPPKIPEDVKVYPTYEMLSMDQLSIL